MNKKFLTYIVFLGFCLTTTGCATTMKSSQVGIGQNVQKRTPVQKVMPPTPSAQSQVTYFSDLHKNLTTFISSYNKTLPQNEALTVADAILKTSSRYKVHYKVITALVAIESGFRRSAKSRSGAMGLGQLMPITARSMKVSNPYDPYDNLNGAVRLLRGHLEKYNGDINFALGAYKMGGGAVSRRGIGQTSTKNYIIKIRKVYDQVP